VSAQTGLPIAGVTALVTGANRGLGRAFVNALLDRGARRVYATARSRDSIQIDDERVVSGGIDITDESEVRSAAKTFGDTTLLINNAGVMRGWPFTTAPDMDAARAEMETNYFGTLSMSREFASVLARNGGGALVNVLSVASFLAMPFNASYGASKSAEWALTNGLRVELHSQGTMVIGVHAGFIDTDMASNVQRH